MKIGIACEGTIPKTTTKFRRKLHSDGMLELLVGVVPTAAKPSGTGTRDDPYRPANLSNWYWLATKDSDVLPMYMQIGGQLIARWGSGGGQFVDYCTDVTDF